ncbi:carbohydrate-binding module family 18 protein [Aplosporella prunicola CBS 121167]|uniref:Carbohydrate-binding module family 18 protein n=1 Tax=Aplosporella prunicola CBS 121167 TaxID=1176127 RepID=A0A6A6BJY3_9PEZI|nr:carbohydrate-binding module family 18 protein [Aplosporella prunicola CBS 121167]KAF2143645.1 carbohydrate-binding module family 18 protein [Aplosporella prunicola CBS 121167]
MVFTTALLTIFLRISSSAAEPIPAIQYLPRVLVASPDNTCGGTTGYTCVGSQAGNCCSSSGWCGKTDAYCNTSAGCQTSFGKCVSTTISPDGTCGGANGYRCHEGECCSSDGFCGTEAKYCNIDTCQPEFGNCGFPSYPQISPDGTCGGENGYDCTSSGFGDCCSSSGYCGDSTAFCAQGCQSAFSASCLTTNIPTLNGACGAKKGGYICAGGRYEGQCCSSDGFCGSSFIYCGTGCQTGFGKCT